MRKLTSIDRERLDEALDGSTEPVVESSLAAPDDDTPDPRRLWVRLTAASAFRADLAHVFCLALAKRLELKDAVLDRVELATQEALANAVLHGALEIESNRREDVATYEAYCKLLDDRLADPNFGGRSIDLIARWTDEHLEIDIVDSGPGYVRGAVGGMGGIKRKSGRGLGLIRDLSDGLAVDDGGRHLAMSFRR